MVRVFKAEVLKDTGAYDTRGGYERRQLVRLTDQHTNSEVVRLMVKRDSYEFQSQYSSQVWTDSAGWANCVSISGEDPAVAFVPNGNATHEAKQSASGRVIAAMLTDTMAILQ